VVDRAAAENVLDNLPSHVGLEIAHCGPHDGHQWSSRMIIPPGRTILRRKYKVGEDVMESMASVDKSCVGGEALLDESRQSLL
jgi:hypothetical protein